MLHKWIFYLALGYGLFVHALHGGDPHVEHHELRVVRQHRHAKHQHDWLL